MASPKNKRTFLPLDDEEKELMASIENDEWQPISDTEAEKSEALNAARNTLKKDRRINLRLSEKG